MVSSQDYSNKDFFSAIGLWGWGSLPKQPGTLPTLKDHERARVFISKTDPSQALLGANPNQFQIVENKASCFLISFLSIAKRLHQKIRSLLQ